MNVSIFSIEHLSASVGKLEQHITLAKQLQCKNKPLQLINGIDFFEYIYTCFVCVA